MLPTPATGLTCHDHGILVGDYDAGFAVDVDGYETCDVLAVTDGVALVVSGVGGGVVDVLVVALSVGPIGGSDVVIGPALPAAVIAPIAIRTPALNAAAQIFSFR
jgi:hypothetical protein